MHMEVFYFCSHFLCHKYRSDLGFLDGFDHSEGSDLQSSFKFLVFPFRRDLSTVMATCLSLTKLHVDGDRLGFSGIIVNGF